VKQREPAADRFGDKIEQTHKGDSAFLALWQSMSGGKPKDAA
jgi:hypothetical protein